MWERLSSDRGLSITEALVALGVFLIAAAGLAASTVAVMRGNSHSWRVATAAALVQGKIEEFRTVGCAALSDELTSGHHDDPENPIVPPGGNAGQFRRSWTVTPASPRDGLAKVEVMVDWETPERGSITSVTLVCENPLCM